MADDLNRTLADLAAFLGARGVAAWLVGGAARDLALGRLPADLDLAVAGDGFALARAYADARGAAFVALDKGRATGRTVIPGDPPRTLDLAALRGPTIADDLRLRDFTVNALALPLTPQPSIILHPSAFIDPTGGLADLRAGMLRACGPASLSDDPLRVLRAARLGASLGLRADPALAPMMRAAAPGLAAVAPERSRDELLKLLDAPAAAPWLRELDACGALTALIPELEPARGCEQPNVHFLPVLAHILETVAALDWLIDCARRGARGVKQALPSGAPVPAGETPRPPPPEALPVAVRAHPGLSPELPYAGRLAALMDERRAGGHRRAALLKLAALLHDVAKPETKRLHPDGKVSFYGHQELGADTALRVARRLRLSRQDAGYVALVVREHMRPGQLRTSDVLTERAVARLFRDLGDAGPDVLLHELADHLATRGPTLDPRGWGAHLAWVGALLAHHYEPAPERRAPLVDGHGLMEALGIGPGPALGALLREVAEAQAAGEVRTREEAIALARRVYRG